MPAPPRSTGSAYGLRFCGMSTLARHSEASSDTYPNAGLAKISRSEASWLMVATACAAASTASARASADHIASRVCGPTAPNPSARARRPRSSGSRVPPTPPAPPGETSASP